MTRSGAPCDASTASPLVGTVVVDLSRLLPGPLAARILADLGARVIKVEEPRLGDPVRAAPPLVRGRSALAAQLLAGVESIALDLRREPARKALLGLLSRADVLLETLRPGGLGRLLLPPEELRERFPRLVVCSLSGWGQDGPLAARAGHDLTYQALAGSLAPTAAMPAVPVADLAGAWAAATAVLAALVARERTGAGSRVDASLYDGALHANLTNWAAEAGGARRVGEPLPLTGALPCYALYPTADGGHLALAALEPKFWHRFCRLVGRPDLRRRQYSADPAVRAKVAAVVARRTRKEWAALAASEDLPLEPVLSAAEALEHPQAVARGVVGRARDGLPRLAFPARFDGARPRAREGFPDLGRDTRAVLAESGQEVPGSPLGRRRGGVGRRFSARRALARLALRLGLGG